MDSMLVDLAGEHPPLINAFSCMKAGLKNCDANGNAGPIPQHAKKLVVCSRISIYFCAFPFLIFG